MVARLAHNQKAEGSSPSPALLWWVVCLAVVLAVVWLNNEDYKTTNAGIISLDSAVHAQAAELSAMQNDLAIVGRRWAASLDTIVLLKSIIQRERLACVSGQ